MGRMLLIGMYDSPFVRRVGVSLTLLGIPFEHANWSVGKDAEKIRQHNPLGRVPTLVLDGGEALIESSAILDWIDEQAGPARALLPAGGEARRRGLKICALAIGAGDKAREFVYEQIVRPPEKRHVPWTDRCRAQLRAAFTELERWCAPLTGGEQWLLGPGISQADITLACMFKFACEAPQVGIAAAEWPAVQRLAERCEALPAFQAIQAPWFAFEPAK